MFIIICGCHNSTRESGRFTDLDIGNTQEGARHPPLHILGKPPAEPFGGHPGVSPTISHNLLHFGFSDIIGVGLQCQGSGLGAKGPWVGVPKPLVIYRDATVRGARVSMYMLECIIWGRWSTGAFNK